MKKSKANHIKEDFLDFKKRDHKSAGPFLSSEIFSYIHKELNPNHVFVFSKLISIQGFVGMITLLFCPQFTLSLTNNHELFHYFHHSFGEGICMMICGAIFIGSGSVFAASILKREEINKIRSTRFLYYFSLISILIMVLILFGAKVYLGLLPYWLFGALFSGLVLFELQTVLRLRLGRLLN
jgi:drug/metabolite transporter (DMT)-like permease